MEKAIHFYEYVPDMSIFHCWKTTKNQLRMGKSTINTMQMGFLHTRLYLFKMWQSGEFEKDKEYFSKELRQKYEDYIKTKTEQKWKETWQTRMGSDIAGDFGDFLYDFYPEMLA